MNMECSKIFPFSYRFCDISIVYSRMTVYILYMSCWHGLNSVGRPMYGRALQSFRRRLPQLRCALRAMGKGKGKGGYPWWELLGNKLGDLPSSNSSKVAMENPL